MINSFKGQETVEKMTHADEMRQVAALERLASMAEMDFGEAFGKAFKAAAQEIVKSLNESQSGGEKASEGVTTKVIMQGERNYYIDFAGKSGTVIIRRL